MTYNIRLVCLCLSYRLLNFYTVQSTTIKEKKSCALDHEVHITNTYKRFDLKGRRQQSDGPPMSLLDMMFPSPGPKKGPKYDPTLGYEPYWPGGEWVFGFAPNKTTKGVSDELCGQTCPEMYKRYGTICARNRHSKHKTFENYCKMINDDCTQRTDWLIAYRGVCLGGFNTYPTKRMFVPTRAAAIISRFLAGQSTQSTFLDLDFFQLMRSTKKS